MASESGDRGQLIIVTGLTIAILFIALALILNSAIYTENVATRSGVDAVEPIEETAGTEERLQRAVRDANYKNRDDNFSERVTDVNDSMADWDEEIANEAALSGTLVAVDVGPSVEGTRVTQDTAREYLPNNESVVDDLVGETYLDSLLSGLLSDASYWLVADNVTIREFEATVERSSLASAGDGGLFDGLLENDDPFVMHFHPDDEEADDSVYRVYLYEDDGDVVANITEIPDGGDGDETHVDECRIDAAEATVAFDDRELQADDDTVDCEALAFIDELPRYDLWYINGENAVGTYTFITDRPKSAFTDDITSFYDAIMDFLLSYLFDDGGGNPYIAEAVYDTTVTVTYVDDEIEYTRDVNLTG